MRKLLRLWEVLCVYVTTAVLLHAIVFTKEYDGGFWSLFTAVFVTFVTYRIYAKFLK